MQLTPGDLKNELVDLGALSPHPQNPRQGDLTLLAASVHQHGVYRSLVVSSDDFILAGNHTYLAAKDEGVERLWVTRLPFRHDDPQALQIMLMDNRAADVSAYDDQQLAMVLANLREQDELVGSGYTDEQVQALLDLLDATPEPPPEPPEPQMKKCPSCGHVWQP